MKFRVTMKDQDTLGDAITDALKEEAANIAELDDEEREALVEHRQETVGEICRQWFKYGEYLTVEIDTEAKTATVCAAD